MQQTQQATLASLMTDLEDVWKKFDEVYASLRPDQWSRKFGKDWTFADQPYHLAYFDRMIANGISKGLNLPQEEKFLLRSMSEVNAWNDREFAKRPAGQTVEQSLQQMRESRDAIRQVVAGMTDADLEKPAWMPILFGQGTVRDLLIASITHNVSEFTELKIRLGRKTPELRPSAIHTALGLFTGFLPMTLNRELAAKKPFTTVIEFTGPGGGAWTFRVADGQCTVAEERAERPDLTMTQSFETFEMLRKHMRNPLLLMLTRKLKVRGMSKMGTFAKLFPEPKPDQILTAN
jgi:hypothetical protein